MGDERAFRCGWRIKRRAGDSWPYPSPAVVIQRGEWQAVMPAQAFDSMGDEEFNNTMDQLYRDATFDHIQRDLDVLARQLLGELEQGNGMIVTGVFYDDIKAALYRWQKAKRDTKEITA